MWLKHGMWVLDTSISMYQRVFRWSYQHILIHYGPDIHQTQVHQQKRRTKAYILPFVWRRNVKQGQEANIPQGVSIHRPYDEHNKEDYPKEVSCRHNPKWSIHKNRECPQTKPWFLWGLTPINNAKFFQIIKTYIRTYIHTKTSSRGKWHTSQKHVHQRWSDELLQGLQWEELEHWMPRTNFLENKIKHWVITKQSIICMYVYVYLYVHVYVYVYVNEGKQTWNAKNRSSGGINNFLNQLITNFSRI